ncbi:tubby-like F-box protein 6 [Wolffia australiana]
MREPSQRVVVDDPPAVADGVNSLKQSCWANMPVELLRDVLSRIEASEDSWPFRKIVVVCASVCRSWRKITMDIVKAPEVSGKLTFPLSLKQPGPKNFPLQCFIKRNGETQTYYLYLCLSEALTEPGKFLLAARRCRHPTYTNFIISLDAGRISRRSSSLMGKLRSNFAGTQFTVHEAVLPRSTTFFSKSIYFPFKSISEYCLVAHVSYGVNEMGSRGPRRMLCTVDQRATSAADRPLHVSQSKAWGEERRSVVLKNKPPRWHEQLQCWCLNFHGRVTMPSVKNFQLVASPVHESDNGASRPIIEPGEDDIVLQFGRVGKDLFTMDFRHPISALQAFAICLSNFETKISCE